MIFSPTIITTCISILLFLLILLIYFLYIHFSSKIRIDLFIAKLWITLFTRLFIFLLYFLLLLLFNFFFIPFRWRFWWWTTRIITICLPLFFNWLRNLLYNRILFYTFFLRLNCTLSCWARILYFLCFNILLFL